MRISDWSSDVCSSDLLGEAAGHRRRNRHAGSGQVGRHSGGAWQRAAGHPGHVTTAAGDEARGGGAGKFGRTGRRMNASSAGRTVGAGSGCFAPGQRGSVSDQRSEEHTSELASLMTITYADLRMKKKIQKLETDSYIMK